MRYMVIERFKQGDARPIYRRFGTKGRLTPEGVAYVTGVIAADLSCCFQVMEADDPAALQAWVAQWSDIVDFEIVPIVESGM